MSPEPLEVQGSIVLPPEELQVSFARSGGPGGQNVNKVETKVILRFNIRTSSALEERQRKLILEKLSSRLTTDGELIVHADRHRERGRNLEDARQRLADLLRSAMHRDPPRRKTKPTRGSVKRRLNEKKRRSDVKRDRGRRGFGDD